MADEEQEKADRIAARTLAEDKEIVGKIRQAVIAINGYAAEAQRRGIRVEFTGHEVQSVAGRGSDFLTVEIAKLF